MKVQGKSRANRNASFCTLSQKFKLKVLIILELKFKKDAHNAYENEVSKIATICKIIYSIV